MPPIIRFAACLLAPHSDARSRMRVRYKTPGTAKKLSGSPVIVITTLKKTKDPRAASSRGNSICLPQGFLVMEAAPSAAAQGDEMAEVAAVVPEVPVISKSVSLPAEEENPAKGAGRSRLSPVPKEKAAPPICPARLVLFCSMLILGLILGQVCAEAMPTDTYDTWKHVVKVVTMFHLSYIMINVGFEFEIDKSNLRAYGKDYLVAMTAATFPWIFCSIYFMFALGEGYNEEWRMALLAGRFAAPTSAGILFTMLEGAGMKETWLFKKARVLAIFDDLDTLLLMVPLKGLIVGLKWELSIDLIWVTVLMIIMYKFLHAVDIPATWYAVAGYAFGIAAFCETVYLLSNDHYGVDSGIVETLHLEILLPAFTVGCIVKSPHATHAIGEFGKAARMTTGADGKPVLRRMQTLNRIKNMQQESVKFGISVVFMVLVGLNMPSFFSDPDASGGHRRALAASDVPIGNGTDGSGSGSGSGSTAMPEPIGGGMLVVHVLACSVLMNLGKMFPAFCYRNEAHVRTRLALAIGMMPRGEVCAGIIVNALALGAQGTAIKIAVLCLAVNMTCVSGFIFLVRQLSASAERLEQEKKEKGDGV